MNIEVDLNKVKEFVLSDSFTKFLLNNTTDFEIAAYILQTLLNNMEIDKNGN